MNISRGKMIGVSIGGLFLAGVLYLLLLTPTHDRVWQPFQSVMTDAVVEEEEVRLLKVRDWQHTATTTYSRKYLEEVVITPSELERVWFTIQPFAAIDAVGHTMLTFELTSGEAYTFSIEARREVGEEYSSFKGLFRQYEVLYSWGTARDFLGVRMFFLGDDLYHYPLELTAEEEWQLLRYVAAVTAEVHDSPRFYNTATANCTNLIAKAINTQAVSTQLPYGLAWNLPGLSDEYLQRHGYIDASYNIENIRSQPGLVQAKEQLQQTSLESERAEFGKLLGEVALEVVQTP